MGKFGAEDFIAAFASEWAEAIRSNQADRLNPYMNAAGWDELMFGDNGLLKRVMNRLLHFEPNMVYRKEFSKIDAAFIGGKDLFRSGLGYPSELYALIEHEKGNYPEEEMWKLLHWRSPLKVIIFFDYCTDEKSTEARQNWVNEKLDRFSWMRNTVDSFHEEGKDTDYLFLIAVRTAGDSPITWLVANTLSNQPTPLKLLRTPYI